MRNYLKELLLALADAGVQAVVGGGVACVLQGVERMTLDLDLAVAFDRENLLRFLSVMKAEGLTPRAPVPPEVLLDPEAVQLIVTEKHAVVFTFVDENNPLRQVDVFLTEDLAYERLDEDADTVSIAGRAVRVASVDRLIGLKRRIDPPREKDLRDLRALRSLRARRGGAS